MKRYRIRELLVFCLVAGMTAGLWAKTQWTRITPQKFDRKVTLLISEKNRTYFELHKDSEIELHLSGPTELKVISRVQIPSSKTEQRYSYMLRRDDGEWIKYSQRDDVATHVQLKQNDSQKISNSKTRVFEIPAGSHTYVFRLPDNSSRREFLRFHLRKGDIGAPVKTVAITPQSASESVELIVGEEITTYYRLRNENPVNLTLIGPASLKILTRLEYSSIMRGQQNYRLQVFEDDSIKSTYSLNSQKSDVCKYKEPSSLVPSKAEKIQLEIPAGEHAYRFVLPENHRTVLIKFLLPKKYLAGEP
ncbi:hypothetical protein KKG05_07975 [bacterium]|nr:hypothetical protein [bacterium]